MGFVAGGTRAAIAVALMAGLFASGCDGDDASADAGDLGDLPCDVATILEDNCLGCHADEPLFGAPMPLTSRAALLAPARTAPERPVYSLVGERIHDRRRPMPPPTAGTLSDEDKSVLDAFVAAMAPPRPAGESCDITMPDGGVDAGPDARTDGGGSLIIGGNGPEDLPCTPSHTFTAHADASDEPFVVPPTADNLYECFTFRSPFAPGEQATAWAPIVDDARVLHHWILYRTAEPQVDGAASRCRMPDDATFVMGWAPGAQNTLMPPDVGLEVGGPDDYYILQMHYWNVAGHTDADDESGVAICTTETPREHEAGVIWLGSWNIDIPPRASGHVVENDCPSFITDALMEPLNVMSSFPHMHELGTHFITEIVRGDDPARTETLVEVEAWDFGNQTSYPHDGVRLHPGDAIITRCTYDNPHDYSVGYGENTEDEMCFNFVTVYPLDALPGGEREVCLLF